MTNQEAAEAFARQFDPPLPVVRTERVNNVPMPDAWTVTYWDGVRKLRVTAVFYHGQVHAYLEAAGAGDEVAEAAGRVIAQALGLFKQETP